MIPANIPEILRPLWEEHQRRVNRYMETGDPEDADAVYRQYVICREAENEIFAGQHKGEENK